MLKFMTALLEKAWTSVACLEGLPAGSRFFKKRDWQSHTENNYFKLLLLQLSLQPGSQDTMQSCENLLFHMNILTYTYKYLYNH